MYQCHTPQPLPYPHYGDNVRKCILPDGHGDGGDDDHGRDIHPNHDGDGGDVRAHLHHHPLSHRDASPLPSPMWQK